jgi:tetratricopeptide (TPR) repeat protein
VQDEIAGAVVAALKLKLSPAQASLPSRSANTDAYLQYLLGQQHLDRADEEDYRQAVEAYRKAVALDPHYAAAYAGLALAENYVADASGDNKVLEQSKVDAEHAVELAPDQAAGYAARGWVRAYLWEWEGSRADFAKAFELDPKDPVVLRRYAIQLSYFGRLSEAAVMARKAIELDPFSAPAWQVLDAALISGGQFAAAREANRNSLAIDPQRTYTLNDLGTLDLLEHRPADALIAFQKIAADTFRLTGVAMAQYSLGHPQESQQALDQVSAKFADVVAYQIAETHAWRGATDKAFDWLERAYRQRDGGLASMKVDPLLASLRRDPRYQALLKRINLPE